MSTMQDQELLAQLNEACSCHQAGELDKAEAHYRRLIAVLPDVWQLHYNLGMLLCERGYHEEALAAYEKAARSNEADKDLFFNMALCCKHLQRYEKACELYRLALSLEPEDVDTHYNLACCLMAAGDSEAAIRHYDEVLARNPDHLPSLNNLACLCHRSGRTKRAVDLYSKVSILDPTNKGAAHMLAALTGSSSSSRAPAEYVTELFDAYSDRYDASLVDSLGYRVPQRLRAFVSGLNGLQRLNRVVDLGCGTGLVGEQLQPLVRHLTGVDLSEQMIRLARAKGVYDELVVGELNDFLQSCPAGAFDLLLAADVVTYIGDIGEFLLQAHRAAASGGILCFTTEDLAGDSSGLRLKSSGRFAHARSYISTAAASSGWRLFHDEPLDLRLEGGEWLTGRLYGLSKRDLS